MDHSLHLQIDFYNEYHASILIETFAQGEDRKLLEILVFNCLALRQMHNLKAVAVPLAQILAAIHTDIGLSADFVQLIMQLRSINELAIYVPFIAALGVDVSELIRYMGPVALERAAAGGDDKELAHILWPNVAHIVNYQGTRGKKQFIVDLDLRNGRAIFHLHPKGFSFLGRGVNYYASMSVVLLLKYLIDKHHGDNIYAKRLAQAASLCGEAFLQGKITSFSQLELPLSIAQQVHSLIT